MTSNLVTINDEMRPVTSSTRISEVFNRDHNQVLSGIETLMDDYPATRDGVYKNQFYTGKEFKTFYFIGEDVFLLLTAGYRTERSRNLVNSYLKEFKDANKKIAEEKSKTATAGLLLINRDLQAENEELKRKYCVVENTADGNKEKDPLLDYTGEDLSIRDFYKLLKENGISIPYRKIFGWFVDNGFMYKDGPNYVPTEAGMQSGNFCMATRTYKYDKKGKVPGRTIENQSGKITAAGVRYFSKLFKIRSDSQVDLLAAIN